MSRWPFLVLLAVVAVPVDGAAQSLLSAGGLGTPIEALDSRSRALGSVGVGLFGGTILPTDPARAQSLTVPMISISLQPTTGTVTSEGVATPIEGTRFPLLGIAYPVGTLGVATLSYGGFLDQRWRAEVSRPLVLAGQPVDATDTFESDGGVSVARLSFARQVTPSLALAVSGGLYSGRQRRTFTRTLDAEQVGATVEPFVTRGRWSMGGSTLGVGAHWDALGFLRVAGSLSLFGDLEASPLTGTSGGERAFGLPTEIRIGASANLTSVIMATVGMTRADWSSADIDIEDVRAAGSVMSVGGGLEWTGYRFWGRGFPIRLGYRRTELPFGIGTEDPVESVFALGFGWNLQATDTILISAFDFSMERGDRNAGSVSESFSRYTLSFRVASF